MNTPRIVLAHGSRHPLADAAIHQVADEVGAHAAFLDFSPRTLENQARVLVASGHSHVDVIPLLFTDAFHARHDVPAVVAETAEKTGITIRLTSTLGTGGDIAEILVNQVKTAGVASKNLAIYAVGSSDEAANQAVRELAEKVGETLRMPCSALFATGKGVDRGVAGLRAYCAENGPTHVIPLFVAPGKLWDMAVESGVPNASYGRPLGTALAGVIERKLT